jgi:hypothetical protein
MMHPLLKEAFHFADFWNFSCNAPEVSQQSMTPILHLTRQHTHPPDHLLAAVVLLL